MGFLKRTLIAFSLAALLLVPGVVTVSHVASADESTSSVTPTESASPAAEPTATPTATPTPTPTTGSGEGGTPASPDPQVTPQPSVPVVDPTDNSGTTWIDCSSYKDNEGNPVDRCAGVDANGNLVAKSATALVTSDSVARSTGNGVTAAAPAQTSTTVTSVGNSARNNAFALAPVNNVKGGGEAVDNPQTQKPDLPVTGTQTTVKKTDKDGKKDTASAALITNNEVDGASSRAGLFALVACAGFAVVAAGSVVGVRRLK